MYNSTFLDKVIALCLLVMVSGVVGGYATGEGAFSLSPVFALLNRTMEGIQTASKVEPEPVPDTARRIVEGVNRQAESAIQTGANGQTDPRLAACGEGGVSGNSDPIPLQSALTLKQQNPKNLLQVQSALGTPHCQPSQTEWRYLLRGGGVLRVREKQKDREGLSLQVIKNGSRID